MGKSSKDIKDEVRRLQGIATNQGKALEILARENTEKTRQIGLMKGRIEEMYTALEALNAERTYKPQHVSGAESK